MSIIAGTIGAVIGCDYATKLRSDDFTALVKEIVEEIEEGRHEKRAA